MKPFLVIAAGGTMDAAEYDYDTGSVISFAKPAALDILEKMKPGISSSDMSLLSPFQKDSDVMTDRDREELLSICTSSHHDRIVITHGSGTIIDTGRLLAQHVKDKTVVLTSGLPYLHDPLYSAFNLGHAVAVCQLQPPGVYIATSGEVVSLFEKEIEKVKAGGVTYFNLKK
jgi:L-asparaginase